MPYDANLILHDGTTITADQTPTSTTRVNGSACIDLKETPAQGLAAILIMGADLAETSDTLVVKIQGCATVDGSYVDLATFATLTKGSGMPGTYIRRFSSEYRYIRANIDVTDSDAGGDFSVASCYILISQYPFYKI